MGIGLGARLRKAVEKGALRRINNGSGKGICVAIAAQKGGVGKTTTAVHLAATLAEHHQLEVLLVDLDNQGHVASSLRSHVRGIAPQTVSSVLLGRDPDLTAAVVATNIEGLSITSADRNLSQTEAQLAGRIGRELLLKRAMVAARHRFDVVILDCPPNLGLLTLNGLVAADHVLIPCDLSILSLEGVDDLIDTLQNLDAMFGRSPELLGLVHTRVDRRNKRQNSTIRRAVADRYQGHVLQSEIGVNTALSGAQLVGKTIFNASPSAKGAQDYRALGDEVVAQLWKERAVSAA
ncbi:MAG TPA: sporulation initiation inhibitor Soj [Myxococcales bacterium]|nr:sporulation initiation inhibitor Soj [Myxococcales bacterium]HAN31165.1 sporulation initiation inhibitor Soj [Myxococcales bacterium]